MSDDRQILHDLIEQAPDENLPGLVDLVSIARSKPTALRR
jgi:hypothetical protein